MQIAAKQVSVSTGATRSSCSQAGRRGASRALLGSDASIVVGASPVPVLLVKLAPGRA